MFKTFDLRNIIRAAPGNSCTTSLINGVLCSRFLSEGKEVQRNEVLVAKLKRSKRVKNPTVGLLLKCLSRLIGAASSICVLLAEWLRAYKSSTHVDLVAQ